MHCETKIGDLNDDAWKKELNVFRLKMMWNCKWNHMNDSSCKPNFLKTILTNFRFT